MSKGKLCLFGFGFAEAERAFLFEKVDNVLKKDNLEGKHFYTNPNEIVSLAEESLQSKWRQSFDFNKEFRCDFSYSRMSDVKADNFLPQILFHRNLNQNSEIFVEYDFQNDFPLKEASPHVYTPKSQPALLEQRLKLIDKLQAKFSIKRKSFHQVTFHNSIVENEGNFNIQTKIFKDDLLINEMQRDLPNLDKNTYYRFNPLVCMEPVQVN